MPEQSAADIPPPRNAGSSASGERSEDIEETVDTIQQQTIPDTASTFSPEFKAVLQRMSTAEGGLGEGDLRVSDVKALDTEGRDGPGQPDLAHALHTLFVRHRMEVQPVYMRAVSTHIVFRLHLCRNDDMVVVGFVVTTAQGSGAK